jgi:hypothetical protein
MTMKCSPFPRNEPTAFWARFVTVTAGQRAVGCQIFTMMTNLFPVDAVGYGP